jgi:hypothetical protein
MILGLVQNPVYLELSSLLHPQDFEVLKQILVNFEFELAPTYGYFAENDFNEISKRALEEFFSKIKSYNLNHLDGEDLRYIWQQVIDSFRKKYWGFNKYQEKPTSYRAPQRVNIPLTPQHEIPKRPPKKISYKDSFFYLWSVIQAMIVTKALILVFGNQLAKDDTLQNRIIFGAVISFSFGSLFFFAWIRRNNPK